jgi:hypothetical protein
MKDFDSNRIYQTLAMNLKTSILWIVKINKFILLRKH